MRFKITEDGEYVPLFAEPSLDEGGKSIIRCNVELIRSDQKDSNEPKDGLLWITNHPKSVQGLWPRRVGCNYVEGDPKPTQVYSVERLKADGDIGVYVRMTPEEYYALPVAQNPKEYAEIEQRNKT